VHAAVPLQLGSDPGRFGGSVQVLRCKSEALDLVELLVLDVDGHVRIDRLECLEERDPELLPVAPPDRHELPGGFSGHRFSVSPAEADRVLLGRDARETVSIPCQNRWLGSISAPTCVALISVASRSMVAGLNTMFCGCISMQTLTSASRARASMSFQNGMATSCHR